MVTGEIIRQLREARSMSQEQLAQLLGYKDRSSIAKIESGKVDLSQSKLAALSQIFDTPVHKLMGLSDLPRTYEVPILGAIACGAPILAQEHIHGYTPVPEDIRADFALTCRGDSMVDAGIKDGDIVYIRQQVQIRPGQIAAVLIDDEATLKRVYFDSGSVILQPANPAYPPMVFTDAEASRVRMIGLAVAFTHSLV